MKKICEGCGSVYEISEQKVAWRDKDSIECDVCGHGLIRWNGGVIYTVRLVERKEKGADQDTPEHPS